MRGYTPLEPSGTDAEAQWMRSVHRSIHGPEMRLNDSPTVRVRRTTKGMFLDAIVGRSSPGAVGATRYRIHAVYDDYVSAYTWDGSTLGSTLINIAKPPELRHNLSSQTIEGVLVGYSYTTRSNNLDGQRTASASGYSNQIEIIEPVYQAGSGPDSEIWADQPVGGTGVTVSSVPLTWMDTNRAARAWCQVG